MLYWGIFTEPFADLASSKYTEKDYQFVEWLTKVKKLAAIPPSAFYSAADKHLGEKYIRFCFIKVNLLVLLSVFKLLFIIFFNSSFHLSGGCQLTES